MNRKLLYIIPALCLVAVWVLSCIICYGHGKTVGMYEMHQYYAARLPR